MILGEESRERFGEPSAPEMPGNSLNAISLCYQIRPSKNPGLSDKVIQVVPDYNVVAHVSGPVGPEQKLTVNPLGILEGKCIIDQDADEIPHVVASGLGEAAISRKYLKLGSSLFFN